MEGESTIHRQHNGGRRGGGRQTSRRIRKYKCFKGARTGAVAMQPLDNFSQTPEEGWRRRRGEGRPRERAFQAGPWISSCLSTGLPSSNHTRRHTFSKQETFTSRWRFLHFSSSHTAVDISIITEPIQRAGREIISAYENMDGTKSDINIIFDNLDNKVLSPSC